MAKVIVEGHCYELENFEDKEAPGQVLQFIHKQQTEGDGLQTLKDGTTNEEILGVLIDRLTFLNHKFPCDENEQSIVYARQCLAELHKRTQKRIARGVEGQHKA